MDEIEIPETLDGVERDQLVEFRDAIRAAAEDDNLTAEQLEALADRLGDIDEAIAAIDEAAAAETARADEARARILGTNDEDAPEDGDEDEPVAEVDDEVEVVAEVDEETGEVVELDEPAVEEPEPVAAAVEPAPAPEPEPAPAAATTVAPIRLNRRRPRTATPPPAPATAEWVATAQTPRRRQGQAFADRSEIARSLADAIVAGQTRQVPTGVHGDFVPVASTSKELEFALGGDLTDNRRVLERARRSGEAARGALVASGARFAPVEPSYELFELGESQNPVEQSMTTVQAPRGGISVQKVAPVDATGALTVQGPGDNLTVGTPDLKNVLHVEVPTPTTVQVSAISQIVEFDNLQTRVWPEQVEDFLHTLGVAYAQRKETFYLDALNAVATATTQANVYGASRDLINTMDVAAAGYRKRHNEPLNALVDVYVPDYALHLILADALNGAYDDEVTMQMVIDKLRDRNLNPVFFDAARTGGNRFDGAQAAGVLNALPGTVEWFLSFPGSFLRLDGGTLDLGTVRDSDLNGSNDVQMFAEEWIGAVTLVTETVKVTSTVTTEGGGKVWSEAITP
ncbi:MAG: major capsid protein [Actinomycetota bacterium]